MLARLPYFAATLLILCGVAASAEPPLPPAANRPIDFAKDVRPIFDLACMSCHGPKQQKSSFRLDRKKDALAGGDFGVAIVPGKSAESALIQRVARVGEDKPMPPEGKRLSAEQVGVLRAWIDQGAKWPDDAAASESKHWAYQPLVSPPVPRIADSDWPITPIDAFILMKLREKQLAPLPPADPRSLLRRVYFDLIGLPPTPEEVAAFVAECQSSSQSAIRVPQSALARVVDRLLASPHYGERWARHWLDVARYAETHGHDQDRPRPNAWPYRDYLVRSFNEDKPYARFVAEQVAGDALYPNEPQVVAALGFLAAGPWDESSLHSIVDDTVDKRIAQVLDRDDMLTTVMTTFVSATVHCARCHNHKFDPITQNDYYALQAVFAGVDKAERTYDPDAAVHARRRELLALRAALARDMPKDKLLTAEVKRRVADWEKSLGGKIASWRVLEPQTISAKNGTKLAKQPDGSYLATEKAPEKETYSFSFRARGQRITAVRLEALTDPSLPLNGPGRQDNGNLHLSELRMSVARSDDKPLPVKIRRASADFNQDGWTIQHAIDGNPATAWGIYPNVGRPHQAIFELDEPIVLQDDVTLTLQIDQLHGGRHLIGRPRLTFTDAVDPHTLQPLPENIVAILKIVPGLRTEEQRLALARHVLNEEVSKQLDVLPKPQMIYAATNDFKPESNFKPALKPRPVHVLRRGDIHQPLEAARPGTLSCVPQLPSRFQLADADNESARRAALAQWLADRNNVLTWRSIVNRVWHYHFGKGLVDTPNDFGRMGAAPSHPELLDWLACWFRDHGGSMKQLHRMIVLSNVYRQSSLVADFELRNSDSKTNPQSAIRNPHLTDADNRLLWRMNRTRLDAESIRDAILQVTGKLDRKMGGPSVKQFNMSPGIHVTPNVDYVGFDIDNPANYRRAVYRFVFRTLPDPFLEAMDCPDASQQAPVRSSSVTALQALAMLNDKFIVRQSEHLAERLQREAKTPREQIRLLYSLTLHREPTAKEIELMMNHAAKFGLPNVCRIVLNCNEFLFVP